MFLVELRVEEGFHCFYLHSECIQIVVNGVVRLAGSHLYFCHLFLNKWTGTYHEDIFGVLWATGRTVQYDVCRIGTHHPR